VTVEPARQARSSRGRFVRSLANIERDRGAAEEVERGATYEDVAARFGFESRQAAWAAVQQIRRENVLFSPETQLRRQQQLDELQQARREAWGLIRNPVPAISRTGKVVTDDDGNAVPDVQGIVAALALVLRYSAQEAKLTGTEMPRKSVSLSGQSDVGAVLAMLDSIPPADMSAALAEMRRRVEEEARRAERGAAVIPGEVEG
jgi:hypothetical protein